MLSLFRSLLNRPSSQPAYAIPPGERVYAIGDIHGRADLFQELLARIETDEAARGSAETTIILLGDLIDRGLQSAQVVNIARDLSIQRRVLFIQGNHEEMFLMSRTDPVILQALLRFGGRETLLSWGLSEDTLVSDDMAFIQQQMIETIPQADFDFLASFETMVRIGDYAFVHAGVRPHIALESQADHDCRWIREPFLTHRGNFGACVVHGHSITDEPDWRSNRIGIDTGAYQSDILTAVGLEGEDCWFLQTGVEENV